MQFDDTINQEYKQRQGIYSLYNGTYTRKWLITVIDDWKWIHMKANKLLYIIIFIYEFLFFLKIALVS